MKFEEISGLPNNVALNSGTSALHLSLLAMELKPGDEVIVPNLTFAATANAVILAGGTPVFADIDVRTFNIDIQSIKNLLSEKTVGMVPVHLFGQMSQMTELRDLALKQNLFILEDTSQSHLARQKSIPPGRQTIGATYSFYPTKNMTTLEGGMFSSESEEMAEKVRQLRNQGMGGSYEYKLPGLNNRMTEVQAVIGLDEIGRLSGQTEKRIANAQRFIEVLPSTVAPKISEFNKHVFHQFTLLLNTEAQKRPLRDYLSGLGIPTANYYPKALSAYPHFGVFRSESENSESACARLMQIPVHPGLTGRQREYITKSLKKFFQDEGES